MSPSTGENRSQFYTCGGTMTGDAPSYVERQADSDLFEALLQGQYCYVLTARQMGKSSLMVRASRRLQETLAPQGGTVVLLDLSSIGQNPSEESWYYTLLTMTGKRLGLSAEMRALWRAQSDLPPLQRWITVLEEVVLKRFSGQVVIFLDEIDMVRSLAFKTDELFIAIRSLYNRRALEPDIGRLTFCLLGVATPSDLIQDAQLTPFNIGKRIELTDFTLEEAALLKEGLSEEEILAEALLERILYWTGGHPYLTQCLCQAISKAPSHHTREAVDSLCEQMFLSASAREKDTNLQFVRDRILKASKDVAAVLELYEQVWSGRAVADSEADERISVLRLSGVVRTVERNLAVRNRIYTRVFDRAWIVAHRPDAEVQRQRKSYWKGVWRTVSVSAILLTVISSLALVASYQYYKARQEHDRAERLLYGSDMVVAQVAYKNKEYGRLAQLLDEHFPKPEDKEDLRDWEWGYFWKQMHQALHTFRHEGKDIVNAVAIHHDGKMLVSANGDGTIKFWDIAAQREKMPGLQAPGGDIFCLAFSPKNPNLLASGSADGTVRLWDVSVPQMITELRCKKKVDAIAFSKVDAIAFSPDGKYLAAGCDDGALFVWEVASHRLITYDPAARAASGESNSVHAIAYSPDGRWLVVGYDKEISLRLFEASNHHAIDLSSPHPTASVFSTAFSPDNRTLAVGRRDGITELWDVRSKRRMFSLQGHTAEVYTLAFSPTSKSLATGSWDNTVRLWDVASQKTLHAFLGHTNRVTCVAFSPDGKRLASGSSKEVKLWDTAHWEDNPQSGPTLPDFEHRPYLHGLIYSKDGVIRYALMDRKACVLMLENITDPRDRQTYRAPENTDSVALSPDSSILALGRSDGMVTLRNAKTGQDIAAPLLADIRPKNGGSGGVQRLAFSRDGTLLAAASGDSALITLWNVGARRKIGTFHHSNAAQGIAFSPDGGTLAVANWQGFVYFWDFKKQPGEVEAVEANQVIGWNAHSKSVTDVAFSSDGKTLATASEDHTVKLWNVSTRREMITFRDHTNMVLGVRFSPDSSLTTIGRDKKCFIYHASRPTAVKARKE